MVPLALEKAKAPRDASGLRYRWCYFTCLLYKLSLMLYFSGTIMRIAAGYYVRVASTTVPAEEAVKIAELTLSRSQSTALSQTPLRNLQPAELVSQHGGRRPPLLHRAVSHA